MIYRFVPHERVGLYKNLGWADRGFAPFHHGCHARVMIWQGEDDDAREPEARETHEAFTQSDTG